MRYIITPQEGIGDWQFGMTRDQIRSSINQPPRVVQKIDLTDIFSNLGLHFMYEYKEPHIFHALMLILPACPYIDGKNLLGGESIESLGKWFENKYDPVETTTDGVTIKQLGIYLSVQDNTPFCDAIPDSVVVYAKYSSYAEL
jgi:hypothetical protein